MDIVTTAQSVDVGIIPLWLTSIATAAGVVYALVRNGSRSKKQNETIMSELVNHISTINKKLDDPDHGLNAIKRSADQMRLHCAETSTRIAGRVDVHSQEIAYLRRLEKLVNDIGKETECEPR